MRRTIYIPDELAYRMDRERPSENWSRVAQLAFEAVLDGRLIVHEPAIKPRELRAKDASRVKNRAQ